LSRMEMTYVDPTVFSALAQWLDVIPGKQKAIKMLNIYKRSFALCCFSLQTTSKHSFNGFIMH